MSRTVFLLGVSLILVTFAFLLTDHLLYAPGVSLHNARRVRLGMTVAEVDAVFGSYGNETLGEAFVTWQGARGEAWAVFDGEGKLYSMRFLSPVGRRCVLRLSRWTPSSTGPVERLDWLVISTPRPTAHSFLDRLRVWVGW